MHYLRVVDEGYRAPGEQWGDPTYWLEVNDEGDAERQLEEYPNGRVLSYDRSHTKDEYGALGIMVIDGNDEWWARHQITQAEFEAKWRAHVPMNRPAERGAEADRPRRQPMNTIAYFEIQSANPENALKFYQALFGWRFGRVEQSPIPYWRIETGGIRGGLLQRPAAPPPAGCGTNAYVCSIEVSDIDAVAEKIASLGGQVALPKFAVPGVCWHAYFVDPDTNTFGVFQPDPKAK